MIGSWELGQLSGGHQTAATTSCRPRAKIIRQPEALDNPETIRYSGRFYVSCHSLIFALQRPTGLKNKNPRWFASGVEENQTGLFTGGGGAGACPARPSRPALAWTVRERVLRSQW